MSQFELVNINRIVLIKKYTSDCTVWPNLVKKKQIAELSVSEVLSKYKGFEGELISSFSLKEIGNEMYENVKFTDYSLLYVISKPIDIPSFIKNQFVRVGYEYGICEEDQTIYSSIFNEILFGSIDKLFSWKNKLNDNLLFENRFLAENYVSIHHQLLQEGKDVENDEDMMIYEIWKYNFS